MNEVHRALLDKAKECGWNCTICDDGSIEFEQFSPAGEDFIFNIEGKDITAEVKDYYEDFDPDEHAKMWVENMNTIKGVPRSIRVLIDDADAIDRMLCELANALEETEAKYYD